MCGISGENKMAKKSWRGARKRQIIMARSNGVTWRQHNRRSGIINGNINKISVAWHGAAIKIIIINGVSVNGVSASINQ